MIISVAKKKQKKPHKVAVEAVAEVKNARSVRQRASGGQRLAT